jgi:divalent metal cation (Fe/Co/Zn/Cd) transporter
VYFWAFVVAMILFTVGGAFSIWEGARRLLHPIEQASSAWTWSVLGAGFVFEAVSFTVAFRSLSRVRAGRGLAEYWRDSRDPTIVTVLLEDAAALISLLLAATGLMLSHRTGSAIWDATASLAIGCVLLVVAGILALENYSLLLGEAAPPRLEREIRRFVQADAAVVGLRALRTMALGPHEFLVALEVVFARDLAATEIEAAVRRLERAIIGALRGGTRGALVVIEPASPEPGGDRRAA